MATDNSSNTPQPGVLNKQRRWDNLYFYQKADVLYQMTFVFCDRFIHLYKDRTRDQVIQAARCCKQNIVEGLADGVTSTEMQLTLLNVGRSSLKELHEDFVDYVKSRHLKFYGLPPKVRREQKEATEAIQPTSPGTTCQPSTPSYLSCPSTPSTPSSPSSSSQPSSPSTPSYPSSPSSPSTPSTPSPSSQSGASGAKNPLQIAPPIDEDIIPAYYYDHDEARFDAMLSYCRTHNRLADYEPYFAQWTDEELCNYAITLCRMTDRMMFSFLKRLEQEFITQGGIKERMYKARTGYRQGQDERLAQLETEQTQWQAEKQLLTAQTQLLQTKIDQLTAQNQQLQAEIAQQETRYQDLRQRALDAYNRQQAEIAQLKADLQQAQAAIKQ